ncbi:DNA-(apurinic or apyrimidinic site) lyase /endonuclease III [Thermanaeromonas toyohensis ToBE]|uniref:Endonuclease III n=1 Tax=Thermanaeromonas toyohensis ToBE TaxID=698762 RepID=A0A1W1W2D3_9FIRM|nr:endonuclease III [Thermanaeromonas toyohensis]SMB99264.1 DNA-(apurinic or apyrimidinic site) lyase /endonuclease III [Thermanaeromonas toyohensis ToBE]
MQGYKVQAILQLLREAYPQAGPQLRFRNPYELLIAAILSAQTSDRQVNRVTERLFAQYPTPEDLAKASPEEVAELIRSLGLYRNKSQHLVFTARELVEKYGGEVPRTREELLHLPGVGRKVANVVLSQAFGQDVIAVDTHVFRVTNRLGLVQARTPEEAEEQLMVILPPGTRGEAHHLFIFHGRRVCRSFRPDCPVCPVQAYCSYYHKEN